jgi:DNA-binding CsgD family transcriptional regulator
VGRGFSADLIGRDHDLEVMTSFVDRAALEGGALLVSGEAGVGKTALLEAAAEYAASRGVRVLRAAGAEFEADVSFATLNQLLYPLFDMIAVLRPLHARALQVSLGLDDGGRSDQLVASTAALELLVHSAEHQPLVVVVDDVPWLDRASSAILAFVARRLVGTRVGFLAARRTGGDGFFDGAGLREHVLSPLGEADSAALLDARFPALSSRVRQRLLADAQGYPLALLELPAKLIGLRDGAVGPQGVLPLSHRLQLVFADRVSSLPSAAQRLLLLAALDGTGDLHILADSAEHEQPRGDLAAAERMQLVHVDTTSGRLTFRHPLIRSAVVAAAPIEERRRAHEFLAERRLSDPARRAWHLAEASVGPDEDVGALLQMVAHANLRRGDSVGAITELLRAADLSPAAADKSIRLAEAAYLGASVTGDLLNVPELLDAARRADPDRGGSLAGAVAGGYHLLNGHGDVEAAHQLLHGAIDELPPDAFDVHNQQLVEALYNLLMVCFFAGRPEPWVAFRTDMDRLRPRPPELLELLAETFADPARTAQRALLRLDDAIARLPDETSPARIVRVAIAAAYLDRLPACRGALWRAVEHGRDGGAVTSAIEALFLVGNGAYWTGEWDELDAVTSEGLALCDTHGYRLLAWPGRFLRSLLAAARGDDATTTAVTNEMIAWASPRGVRAVLAYAWHARALAALGRADYDDAYHFAGLISPPGTLASHVPHALWTVMDLVEAAVRSGRHREADAHVAVALDAGIGSLSPRLDLIVRGSAAIASVSRSPARAFDEALDVPGAERWPFDLARIQLAYGVHLRRRGSKSEARTQLVAARDTFQRLQAHPWARRAGNELRATGVTIGTSGPTGPPMTPQQLEIAELAAAGLTNKEIGERLFLSPRTVGSHLYQLFPKLGITSRAALRDALEHIPTPR